jgi:hypothetical protein
MRSNPGKTAEDAEREFLEWIDGLGIDSRIERSNRMMRTKFD